MNIKISELYTKCEDMAEAIGLSLNDKFVFDLQDDTSLESIKKTFKGIDKILQPGTSRYLVLMVSNEKPSVLMAVFPETDEGSTKLVLFNVKNQESLIVGNKGADDEEVMTLDNFKEILATDEVEAEVNEFLFSEEEDEDEEEEKDEDGEGNDDDTDDEEDEVVDAGEEDENPAELGDGEPADVEGSKELTDDEEAGDEPAKAEVDDEDDEDVIDVVDDEEDGEEDEEVADEVDVEEEEVEDEKKDVVKEGTAPAAPLADPPSPAAADAVAAAPTADPAATVIDPEKDIRALIKFYTDELARKTADETVSTEVVSGIQAIIAGLVKNLEAMTDLQDTETEEAKAAAKAAKDEKKDEKPEEVSEDGVPPAIEADPVTGVAAASPAAKVGGDTVVPVDQNVTLSTANMTADLKTLQPDDVDVTLPPPELLVPATDPSNDLSDVELVDTPTEEEPMFDVTVDVPDVIGAGTIITDAPIDPATGMPKETPAGADATLDSNPPVDIKLPGDEPSLLGPDGLPSKDLDAPSDKFIDDQIASLSATPDSGAVDGEVRFVPGANTINWSDNLYDTGAANSKDNADTVPQALKELKEYASRVNKKVGECVGVNEVTIGRINKFCNLCATAYDTWHKIQDALNASNPLREAMECNQDSAIDELTKETDEMAQGAAEFDALDEKNVLNESVEDFARVQEYIKSISHLL